MIEWRQNSGPKKIPGPKITPKKIPCQINPKLPGSFLIPQKIPYLNQVTQEILAKFCNPKKSRNRKFQTQKNPLIIPVISKPEYPPWGVVSSSSIHPSAITAFINNLSCNSLSRSCLDQPGQTCTATSGRKVCVPGCLVIADTDIPVSSASCKGLLLISVVPRPPFPCPFSIRERKALLSCPCKHQ